MTGTPVLLECFHTVSFTPPARVGDQVYCRRCGKSTRVMKGGEAWSVRCTGCTFGRSYGTDEGLARRSAARHANARHHPVLVKEGKAWRATVGGDDQAVPGTVNDWSKKNPGHQGALRSLSNRNLH